MKGIQGLIIAIGLAIAGAIANYAYLLNKSRELDTVAFIGVNPDVTVARGERLQESHFVPIDIPRKAVGNLKDFAYLFSDLRSVEGRSSWRTLESGTLLLRSDLQTPPQELKLGEPTEEEKKAGIEYRALGVPVDPNKVVPSLVLPGDLVSFIAPRFARLATPGEPTPAPEAGPATALPIPGGLRPVAASGSMSGGLRLVGPFKILSLGNRLGDPDVMKSARISQVQENVMMIRVRVEAGQLEAQAQELLRVMDETNSRPLGYLLHPREQKKD